MGVGTAAGRFISDGPMRDLEPRAHTRPSFFIGSRTALQLDTERLSRGAGEHGGDGVAPFPVGVILGDLKRILSPSHSADAAPEGLLLGQPGDEHEPCETSLPRSEGSALEAGARGEVPARRKVRVLVALRGPFLGL
jgi:hypothetical protein